MIQRYVAKVTDMATVWMDDISEHYAVTLRHWRERFVANSDLAAELGYDEPFRRLWTLWLAMCEGGFCRAPHPRRADAVQQARTAPPPR